MPRSDCPFPRRFASTNKLRRFKLDRRNKFILLQVSFPLTNTHFGLEGDPQCFPAKDFKRLQRFELFVERRVFLPFTSGAVQTRTLSVARLRACDYNQRRQAMADIKLKLSINFLREIKRTAFYDVINFVACAFRRERKFILATPMRIIWWNCARPSAEYGGLIKRELSSLNPIE